MYVKWGLLLLTSGNKPVDPRCYNVSVFCFLQHVHTLVVNVAGMVYDINAMLDAHLDRISGASVGTEPLAMSVCLIDTGSGLCVREIAVIGGSSLGNLKVEL